MKHPLSDEEYEREMEAFKRGSRLYPPGRVRYSTREERVKEEKEKIHLKKMQARKRRLTFKEGKFIEGKAKGLNNKDAAIFAGYSPISASTSATKLLKREKIVNALEKAGLSDDVLAETIKVNIEAGSGIKATADTALKGVELALKLKGHLQGEEKGNTNIQINDLRNLSDEDLLKRMEVLQGEVIQ